MAYSYDNIGQLKIANSSVPAEDCGYFYDAAWNLNRRTNNGVTGTFTVDNKNELTNAPVGATLSYDSNGNLLTYQTGHDNKSYAYDDENRLVDWQDAKSGLETVLIYDGMGRLRVRQEYQNLGSSPLVTGTLVSETHYIYDGWRVIQERDGANTPTASYTRGNDLSVSLEGAGGIGGLLARSDGYSSGNWTSNECYYADGNGNVTSLTDGNQAVVAGYRYDPFGNIVSKSGTLADANVYRFSSKEIHVNSGMHYYGFRFYDPSLQRWINRDPIGEQGGLNLYGYARNNPVSIVDPKGLCPPSDAYSLMGMGGESMAPFANPAGVQSLANAGAAAQQAGFPSDKVVSAAGDASFNDAMRLTSPVSLSGGLQLSGAATAAPTLFGGHAEGAFGLGLFPSGPGGFASHGESIGPAGLVSPQNPDDKISLNPAWGSFIGGGPGAWLSNAQCPSDLQNTVQNLSFNIGLFDFGFGASLSWGNGIWQATFSPPTPISLGAGIDLSLQRTTTVGF